MNATSTNSKARNVLNAAVAGAAGIFLIAGVGTWAAVATNLKAEQITVSADAAHFAGELVDTPWEAFAEADIIKHHSLAASQDKTYAEIGADMNTLEAQLTEDGLSPEEIKADETYAALAGARTTVMNGSFLRASLFTSVIAFGVGALVAGLGVVLGLIAFALRKLDASAQVGCAALCKGGDPCRAVAAGAEQVVASGVRHHEPEPAA